MSMNHLVGGRAFTLVGTTRKDGRRSSSRGRGWWTAFSLEARRLVHLYASLKFLTEMLRLLAVAARRDKGKREKRKEKKRKEKRGKPDDDVHGLRETELRGIGARSESSSSSSSSSPWRKCRRGYCILTSVRLAESLLSDFAMRYKHGWRPV